ncbi:hypothetical protein [Pseudomonas sp.]|uniref:hypothetical protein n=1 Tax=Pseudomonas sp. TaxID=306 RepID=UPI00290AB7AE|nr:hypothetical protein [Pseudomonas sp.]MDU4254500.1 hypothetical protein [Pseudomonas sp.]
MSWFAQEVPTHPETRLHLECKTEGGMGRTYLVAYDGTRFVHGAFYSYATWYGHCYGQLLMPAFIAAAEAKAAAPA